MLVHFESQFNIQKACKLVAKAPGCVPSTDFALAEYVGVFPDRSAHGNATEHMRDYYCTPGPVMEDIGKLKVYATQKCTQQGLGREQRVMHPKTCSRQETRNTVTRRKNYKPPRPGRTTTKAFANILQTRFNLLMVQKHPFMQPVGHGKDQVPSAIMYTEEQLMDTKRFCCSGETVLGSDKTCSHGNVFVTAGVFKRLTLNSATTGEHSIIIDPVFLHGNSTFDVYHQFFSSCRQLHSLTQL